MRLRRLLFERLLPVQGPLQQQDQQQEPPPQQQQQQPATPKIRSQ